MTANGVRMMREIESKRSMRHNVDLRLGKHTSNLFKPHKGIVVLQQGACGAMVKIEQQRLFVCNLLCVITYIC